MDNISIKQLITAHNLDKPEINVFFIPKKDSLKGNELNLSEFDTCIIDFIKKNLNSQEVENLRFSTKDYNNFQNPNSFENLAIINSERINNIRYLNKYFELINLKLKNNGKFIGCFQSYTNRKYQIKNKFPKFLFSIISFFDFILNRIAPKLPFFKKLYFSITKGRRRVISRAEAFGRLYSCGFELVDHMTYDGLNYFIAKKRTKPKFDLNPTYGPLIALKRVGKNKKLFKVYKVRTMHPYSEYLQEYVYKHNALRDGGKFKDDFRVSPMGRILRKFWIDEIPMIINVVKGEMKLVGVRPLSPHYFGLYREDLQNLRTQFKPGLIPPFYADKPKTFEEIMESEMKYLKAYSSSPIKTDIKYCYLSIRNIIFKGIRSY